MQFVARVAQLDDEAASRLADLENRARIDVSDLERARNYADALKAHYGNHLTRLAERLKLPKGWPSKMLKVTGIPDAVLAAFASPADVQFKPAYALAQALDDEDKAGAIRKEVTRLTTEQAARRSDSRPALPAAEVLRLLLAAPEVEREQAPPNVLRPAPRSAARDGEPMLRMRRVDGKGGAASPPAVPIGGGENTRTRAPCAPRHVRLRTTSSLSPKRDGAPGNFERRQCATPGRRARSDDSNGA